MVVLRGGTHIDNDKEERISSARVGTYFGMRMLDRMAAEIGAP